MKRHKKYFKKENETEDIYKRFLLIKIQTYLTAESTVEESK